jgi:pimeloyl-ACP methyl ester carboxylesterase
MNERLLILPGWGSNSERWQRVKELLEEKGTEVFILDLPGFGRIPSPPEVWGRSDYIDWIFQRVKEKNWQKFNLLGHSFGGSLAVKIATNPTFSQKGERIGKLILCAPAIIRRRSSKSYLFYWLAFLGKKIFSLPGLKKLSPLAQKLIYKLAGTRDYYIADGIMKEVMKKIWTEEDLLLALEKIEIPTLILWGEKDDVLPVKDAYEIKEKIKNSELKIIPKAKHSPHREVPDELAEIIINFLQ